MSKVPKLDKSRYEDAELISRILSHKGEKEAFERLVDKYWQLLVAWVRPRVRIAAEAEDIAQEAFIRVFRSLAGLKDPSRFMSWLLRIARNLAADSARKHHETKSLSWSSEGGDLEGILPAPGENLDEKIDGKERYRKVLKAVDRLPDKYRVLIMLRYFEGLSGSEIALILDEPEGTIRNRLFRAHEKIRGLLGGTSLLRPESSKDGK